MDAAVQPPEYVLRYEALLDLFARVRRQTDVEGLARAACDGWRFCVGAARWRLLVEDDDRLLVLEGEEAGARVERIAVEELSDFEATQWRRRLPALIGPDIARGSGPPPSSGFETAGAGQLAVLPLGGRRESDKALLLAVSAAPVFSKIDLKFLDAVGAFLASEIDALRRQQRLTDLLRAQSLRDHLTGLANRLHFEQRFAADWSDARRSRLPISVLMIDVDHFKQFNDRFGHVAGDSCLQRVAGAIVAAARRPLDFAARFGGEEFVMLLPKTDAAGAATVAETARLGIRALGIAHVASGRQTIITASIGVATIVPGRDDAPRALVEAADAALYRAKQAGRDRCVAPAPLRMAAG